MSDYQYCNQDWKIAARNIFLCIIGIVILTPFTVIFASFSSADILLEAFGAHGDSGSAWSVTITVLLCVVLLGLLVWYVISLTKFKNNQLSDESRSSIGTIRTYAIIQLSGLLIILLSMIAPKTGAIIFILWVFALIIMQFILKEAFHSLSEEKTWSKMACRGASQLKKSVAYTIYGMFAPILWMLLFLLTAFIVSGVKDIDMMVILYDLSQGNVTAYLLPFFVLLICGLVQLYWGVMSFVLMLMGWNNIQGGSLVDPDAETQKNTPATDNSYRAFQFNETQPAAAYCTQCGTKLNSGIKFCPSCGTPVTTTTDVTANQDSITSIQEPAVSSVSETMSVGEIRKKEEPNKVSANNSTISEYPDYYEEQDEDSNKKKYIIAGSIALAVILAIICGFFIFKGDKGDGTPSNIYNYSATVYKTVEDWSSSDPQGELEYGDSVTAYEKDPSGNWIEVKAEKNGKTLKGYVEIKSIMDTQLFNILNQRGYMNEENVRYHIRDTKSRRALAEKLNELGENWLLVTEENDYGVHPISKSCFIEGLTPSEEGFGFMVIDNKSGDKKFILFSFDDNDNPVEVYQESVASKWVGISDIKIKRGKIKVNYYQSDTSDEKEVFEMNNTIIYKGNVDNQYPITMSLNMDGSSVTGSYYYDKYKTPISLSGEITNNEESGKSILLTEMNDGVVTGQFLGILEGSSISGSWISADGEKEMPFYVEEKY